MLRSSPITKILFLAGSFFSPFYSRLMRFRAFLYAKGIYKQHRLPALVISVGNLTLGGTGKTPMIRYLAKFLLNNGRRPAVLSRGYGSKANDEINVISDGENVLLDAEIGGDEPRMLADTLPGVPIITGRKRHLTGNYSINYLGVDSILLDDGFQHLGVKRDIDLVLFNANTMFGNKRVFPGGDLREPLSALQRAHCFIITNVDRADRDRLDVFTQYLKQLFPDRPIFTASHQTSRHLKMGEKNKINMLDMETASRIPLLAFSGIANPDSFKQTLSGEYYNIKAFKAFRDHHFYSAKDIRKLSEQAKEVGAQALITTEKDFVKLGPRFFFDIPILSLEIELLPEKAFELFLAEQISKIGSL